MREDVWKSESTKVLILNGGDVFVYSQETYLKGHCSHCAFHSFRFRGNYISREHAQDPRSWHEFQLQLFVAWPLQSSSCYAGPTPEAVIFLSGPFPGVEVTLPESFRLLKLWFCLQRGFQTHLSKFGTLISNQNISVSCRKPLLCEDLHCLADKYSENLLQYVHLQMCAYIISK